MEKVLTFARAEQGREEDASDTRVLRFPETLDRANRTFMCTVLFLDIVEYSKKLVADQLKIKHHFNTCISAAIQDIAVNDRIILDTGDGVAVNFLGDPEDALFVAMNLSKAFASTPEGEPELEVRTGINLGPVRLVRDINGQPNIIGDGINVAERVMSFARPGQVLVSRSYFEVVTRISEDYAKLFAYQGSRTDKHVREHEIYEVASAGGEACDLATRRHRARPAGRPALVDLAESTQAIPAARGKAWLGNRALAFGAVLLSGVALVAAVVFHIAQPGDKPNAVRVAKPAIPPRPNPAPPAAVEPPAPLVVAEATPPAVTQPEKASEPAEPLVPKARKEGSAHKQRARIAKVEAPPAHEAEPAVGRSESKPAPEPALPSTAAVAEQPAPQPAPAPAHSVPKAPSGPTALLTLAVSPWGEVMVDGKSVGVSPPMTELELAPGTYRIEIRNGNFKPYQETLALESNQTIRIKYKFK